MHIRVLLHALDRTGPPMLGLALVRELRSAGEEVDVVAFRGGPMLGDFIPFCPTRVLVDPNEPWDHEHPDPAAQAAARSRCAGLANPDVTLAVSVSAGQVLPYLSRVPAPLVTWVVEQGEDLHWLDDPGGIVASTSMWLAGSESTRTELTARDGWTAPVDVAPEFIEVRAPDATSSQNCRTAMDADDAVLVVGAGIATPRKGADLFLEVGARYHRSDRSTRFVWLGGESDIAFPRLLSESRRLGSPVRFLGNVTDVSPWLAAADVFLHTARLDAFPLVALHAASVGTPVVGFAGVGGLEEMFDDAAVCARYPDLAALCELVMQLADRDNGRLVGEAQRQRVIERYAAETAASTVTAALRRATSGSSAGRPPLRVDAR